MLVKKNKGDKKGERYIIDGESENPKYLSSVTEVLDTIGKGEALIQWAASQERSLVTEAAAGLYEDIKHLPKPIEKATFVASLAGRLTSTRAWRRELEKAQEIGTGTHKLVEWSLRKLLGQDVGAEPAVPEKSMWGFMAFDDWRKSVNFQPILIEQVVWSDKHEYAGTLDIVGMVNGKRTIIDVKTSKAIYPETNFLQVAAYWKALEEMGHEPPEDAMILRLPKKESDPEFEVRRVDVPVDVLFSRFLSVLEVYRWKVEIQGREK